MASAMFGSGVGAGWGDAGGWGAGRAGSGVGAGWADAGGSDADRDGSGAGSGARVGGVSLRSGNSSRAVAPALISTRVVRSPKPSLRKLSVYSPSGTCSTSRLPPASRVPSETPSQTTSAPGVERISSAPSAPGAGPLTAATRMSRIENTETSEPGLGHALFLLDSISTFLGRGWTSSP